ncbi:hypothetical protein CY35_16G069800 [Sphagnum magellanicum]|nr:hypothetical protein CY35_16G069800 [Sphagnum magellanicum]KAH9537776.1 hypothetical protein CY35_16G069800 [Sphagnum magellanicum]
MSNTIKTLGIVCLLFFLLCRLRFGSWNCRESHTKCNNQVCNLWVFQILTGSFLRRRSCEFQRICDSMEICTLLFRTNHCYIFLYPHDQRTLELLKDGTASADLGQAFYLG